MRVAIFTETFLPKLDGVVTITCLTLDHFRRAGIEALVISPGQHIADYNGYRVISLPGVPMPGYPEAKLGLPGPRTYQALKAFAPDVVHVINPWFAGIMGMQFARSLHKPLVLSFHTHLMRIVRFYGLGVIERPVWALHRFVYNRADLRLATSRAVIEDLEAHGFRKIHLWRRGVDSSLFSPHFRSEAMRARLTDGHPERVILLFVGRVAAEKQIDQLRPLLELLPGTHLAIVGDGPDRPRLERHFSGLPVTFTGYMHGDSLSAAYASSDIFTFASAVETFGLVIAEAMASGLPVVTSRVGGVADLIQSGENGLIFEPNDGVALLNHTRRLVEDEALRRAMGGKARSAIQPQTWEAIMDELLEHYRTLIRGGA